MRHKIMAGLVALGGVAVLSAVLLTTTRLNSSNFVFSTEVDYGIILNKDNTLALTSEYSTKSGDVLTKLENKVAVTYTDAKTYADGVAALKAGGSIENDGIINGIEAITVEFTGTLYVKFSADKIDYTEPEVLDSNEKIVLAKTYDYFVIEAGLDTTIDSINIKHSCESRFTLDDDTKLEAELALLDRQRCWSDDAQASNGAYALAINDCGQGMYYRYYAFEAGERDITVRYATGAPGSYMNLRVNGDVYKVTYSENTGWFGDTHVMANVVVEDVQLVQGWNELYLIKDGVAEDNPSYGGWAQVDYIVIEGTHKRFDHSEFNMSADVYNLVGSVGHFHWGYDRLPERNPNFSMGYYLGGMDTEGDGVKFDVVITDPGKYAIRPVVGGNKYIKVSIDNGPFYENDFGAYSAWDNPVIGSAEVCQVELTAGTHIMDFHRTGRDNSTGWFTFEKLVIEKIA